MNIRLVGKTNKAKNRLREAGTSNWVVIAIAESVAFSQRDGPWYYVRPDSSQDKRDHARWVSGTNDPDFTIVFGDN